MDLWNALQKHMGHNVKITFEGAEDNPENILLQCEDCHFDILSADIETVCARELSTALYLRSTRLYVD